MEVSCRGKSCMNTSESIDYFFNNIITEKYDRSQ